MTEQEFNELTQWALSNSDRLKKEYEDSKDNFIYDHQEFINSQFEKYGSIPKGYI